MATQTISIPLTASGTSGDYFYSIRSWNSPGTGDTWANRWPDADDVLQLLAPTYPNVEINVTIDSKNNVIYMMDITVDVTGYAMILPSITEARIKFTPRYPGVTDSNDLFGGSSTYDSFAIASMRETIRGAALQASNYDDAYDGIVNGTEYGNNRIALASMVHATEETITLSSAGLSYVQGAMTKSDNPGYLFFSGTFGGLIDLQTPDLTHKSNAGENIQLSDMTFEMDFDDTTAPLAGMEIGGSTVFILGSKINISGTWKDITEVKINIGDVWKDVI